MTIFPFNIYDDYLFGLDYSIIVAKIDKGVEAKCVVHNFNGSPIYTKAHVDYDKSLTENETVFYAISLAIKEANETIKKRVQPKGVDYDA